MNSLFRLCCLFCLSFPFGIYSVSAQQTVGLFQYDAAASDGYNLFTPLASTNTYLIDNCGREIHRWASTYTPGNSVYLQPDGILLRTARTMGPGNFSGGGIGGRIEQIDWSGSLVWGYDYTSATVHQHHDVEYLPNGNILVMAWESKTTAEASAAGRNPSTSSQGLWPDHIVELQPTGSSGANIVWEWHAWDHLIQDFDSTKANFGVVADHPELVDINYTLSGPGGQLDWMHSNAIAYHPVLDQIVISVRNFSEFWVIDHSTTTAEAASHSGGNSGKGGDLLYRWGNPQCYGRGNANDQQLFVQHNVHWIPDSLPGGGSFIVFSNGTGRPQGNYSTIEVVTPPLDAQGNYSINPGQAFGPAAPSWNYTAANPSSFYSSNISGATRMPNGNTLICNGARGRFFEVDSTGTMVWDYVNPVALGTHIAQGNTPNGNNVFRVERYPLDYSGFQGQTLSPGNRLEVNPDSLPAICNLVAVTGSNLPEWKAGPIPFDRQLTLYNPLQEAAVLQISTVDGRVVRRVSMNPGESVLTTDDLPAGIYLLRPEGSARTIKAIKF